MEIKAVYPAKGQFKWNWVRNREQKKTLNRERREMKLKRNYFEQVNFLQIIVWAAQPSDFGLRAHCVQLCLHDSEKAKNKITTSKSEQNKFDSLGQIRQKYVYTLIKNSELPKWHILRIKHKVVITRTNRLTKKVNLTFDRH